MIVRRFVAWRKRRQKSHDMWGWLARWDSACAKSWRILSNGTPTKERFERWQRSHGRLCRLIEAKNSQSTNTQ